jgi:hypothetical protein
MMALVGRSHPVTLDYLECCPVDREARLATLVSLD